MGKSMNLSMLTTIPSHSIIHQSFHSEERSEPLNGDGFGLAWYAPQYTSEPVAFRSITPAWNNRNLQNIVRVTESHCILAHVRAASPGLPVVETNCHPFIAGDFAFMHNGFIPQFHKVKRSLQHLLSDEAFAVIQGTTDSEHMFALFLDAWRHAKGSGALECMTNALNTTLGTVINLMKEKEINEVAQLNLVVSDGVHTVASRYTNDPNCQANTLYWHEGAEYKCVNGKCVMLHPEEGHGAILVASEPLSEDPGWEAVPVNHLVIIDAGKTIALRKCEL